MVGKGRGTFQASTQFIQNVIFEVNSKEQYFSAAYKSGFIVL